MSTLFSLQGGQTSRTLDLHGCRAPEARGLLGDFFDGLGSNSGTVITGKGTGVMRDLFTKEALGRGFKIDEINGGAFEVSSGPTVWRVLDCTITITLKIIAGVLIVSIVLAFYISLFILKTIMILMKLVFKGISLLFKKCF